MENLLCRLTSERVLLRVHDILIKGNTKTKDQLIEAEIEALKTATTVQELIQAFTPSLSKIWVEPSGCIELVKHVKLGCPNLKFSGLMTIGMADYSSTPKNFRDKYNSNDKSLVVMAVAGFMFEVMDKSVLFNPSQIVLTAGAASAIEMVSFCLTDASKDAV